jgi:hypothetical protein
VVNLKFVERKQATAKAGTTADPSTPFGAKARQISLRRTDIFYS